MMPRTLTQAQRAAVREFIDRVAAHDPVPCNGCTACCRGDQAVELNADHGDDPDLYGPENLAIQFFGKSGRSGVVLMRRPNGDCTFLRKGRCTIYEKRPAACRSFDCRRIRAAVTRDQRRTMVQERLFTREVFAAARDRMHTLRLLPEEAGIQAELGDFLMDRSGRATGRVKP